MLGLASPDQPDWDTYWRWEIFRRDLEPMDFRRWKGDSSRELRRLPWGADRDGRAPLLLDSTCGMGYHAIIQHELGFRVDACDRCAVALAAARRLAEREKADIRIFQASWEELGRVCPERYDLVWSDEIHQVRDPDELLRALRGICGALRPGGGLVFFFADAAKPDDGRNQAAFDWEQMPKERVAWVANDGRTEVTLCVLAERRDEEAILLHHVYLVREQGAEPRVESLTMVRNYRWDFSSITPVLEEAGFSPPEGRIFRNVHGLGYSMCFAARRAPGAARGRFEP